VVPREKEKDFVGWWTCLPGMSTRVLSRIKQFKSGDEDIHYTDRVVVGDVVVEILG